VGGAANRPRVPPVPGPRLQPMLVYSRAEAGRILLTASGHSGVADEDRAYLVRLVGQTTDLAQPQAVERRVDTVIANARENIRRAGRSGVVSPSLPEPQRSSARLRLGLQLARAAGIVRATMRCSCGRSSVDARAQCRARKLTTGLSNTQAPDLRKKPSLYARADSDDQNMRTWCPLHDLANACLRRSFLGRAEAHRSVTVLATSARLRRCHAGRARRRFQAGLSAVDQTLIVIPPAQARR
jgi:hypothetical protein